MREVQPHSRTRIAWAQVPFIGKLDKAPALIYKAIAVGIQLRGARKGLTHAGLDSAATRPSILEDGSRSARSREALSLSTRFCVVVDGADSPLEEYRTLRDAYQIAMRLFLQHGNRFRVAAWECIDELEPTATDGSGRTGQTTGRAQQNTRPTRAVARAMRRLTGNPAPGAPTRHPTKRP